MKKRHKHNGRFGASVLGLTFGMLKALSVDPREKHKGEDWIRCECACGNMLLVRRDRLVDPAKGRRSCGCVKRAEADTRSPYPLPLPEVDNPRGVVLPRNRHSRQSAYLEKAENFAKMFSPRGEPKDCLVSISRRLYPATPTHYELTIRCLLTDEVLTRTSPTVRRLFMEMSKYLQTKGRRT